jgi:Fur family transcriptional regulator, peroxide stress response regulator
MLDERGLAHRMERFERACQSQGIKLTLQRREVLREVALAKGHPNAEQVIEGLRARLPTVSIDTVYRTLWLLTELGLLTTLGPRRAAVRFDTNLSAHHHFVCQSCGETLDVELPELEALVGSERWQSLGVIDSCHLTLHGRCHDCQSHPKPEETPEPRRSLL